MSDASAKSIIEGSASIIITAPPGDVFAAVSDITRMGDWSPECVAGRWAAPAEGPEVGAKFEGDNVAKLGPVTLKKWTTTSEVTACEPGEIFEFVAEGYSTWRYEFAEHSDGTMLTESFSYPQYTGVEKFFYETLGRRSKSMVGGLEATLARIKTSLES